MRIEYKPSNIQTGENQEPESCVPRVSLGRVALLTGGQDRPYALGLALGVTAHGVQLDVIGSDEVDSPEFHLEPQMDFLNLRGSQSGDARMKEKVVRLLAYYWRLVRYAAMSRTKVFHILWNNKFEYFDRTILMVYYKLLGKNIALTAHNVNAGRRDGRDSWLNRFTLRAQYSLADHIFVHTEKMKNELVNGFRVNARHITVLTHPINNVFPDTRLTCSEAKRKLGIEKGKKTLLFFGRIRPYKGLEHLVAAFEFLAANDSEYRLIIAGEQKKGSEEYARLIEKLIAPGIAAGRIIPRFGFVPDEEAEVYFKAADVLVLPYKEIFQSGVLFLAYAFGLPVLGTDVGSFREAIQQGKTGLICRSCKPQDLCDGIEMYFASDLYLNLDTHRREIRDYGLREHSWDAAARRICNVYMQLAGAQ